MHPTSVPAPLVAIIAIFTPINFAAVLTAFIRLASHVRPNAVHFIAQLSPLTSVFTQLTNETHGGDEAMSRVKPLPQTQAEALVEPTGLVPAVDPHGVHTGVAAEL